MDELAAVVKHSVVVIHVHSSAGTIAQANVQWPRTANRSQLRLVVRQKKNAEQMQNVKMATDGVQ
jgi:hypothetical protein